MLAIDTNVLLYAYSDSDAAKRDRARTVLTASADGVLLWQVACEFVAAARKIAPSVPRTQIWERLGEIRSAFPLVLPTPGVLERAHAIHTSGTHHDWDCLIFAACIKHGIGTLLSEDVPGAKIAGLEVVNPFAT
ncbi:MAG: PIN domain-containing protein [Phycisphaerales bacterium]